MAGQAVGPAVQLPVSEHLVAEEHRGRVRRAAGLLGQTAQDGARQILGGVQAGYNDIGVLTAPDGRSYAIAVMIKKTSTPL